MITKTIDVHNAQVSLEEILSLIREGADVILTDASTPLARMIPLSKPRTGRITELHPGAIWTSDDFDDPLPEEFWTEGA